MYLFYCLEGDLARSQCQMMRDHFSARNGFSFAVLLGDRREEECGDG